MRLNHRGLIFIAILGMAMAFGAVSFAADEPADDLVRMTVQLLTDNDKDMARSGWNKFALPPTGPPQPGSSPLSCRVCRLQGRHRCLAP